MKCKFKINCEYDGKEYGFEKHKKPGIHEVPASLILNWHFAALVKEGKIEILEAKKEEFEGMDEKQLETLDIEVIKMLEAADHGEESSEEGEEEEESEESEEGEEESSEEESDAPKVSKKKKKKRGSR